MHQAERLTGRWSGPAGSRANLRRAFAVAGRSTPDRWSTHDDTEARRWPIRNLFRLKR